MTINATIPMPAISFHLGSNDDAPYQIDPSLFDLANRGPQWFYSTRVQEAVDQGITKIMLHRPFGEPEKPGFMDIDSLAALMESGDPKASDYAQLMLRETVRFFAANLLLEPTIYIGSMRQASVAALAQGHTMQWAQRIVSAIVPFVTLGDRAGVRFNFVFDHSSSFEPGSQEEAAFAIISAMLPSRVQMEAAPKHANMWGTPSWAAERYYLRNVPFADGQLGQLTRILRHKETLEQHYPLSRGGMTAFVLDCHLNGHACMIASHIEYHAGLTISEARDQAQAMLDAKERE